MDYSSKIYVAGHTGLVGSAIVRKLEEKGYTNIVTRTHAELDLIDQSAVRSFFSKEKEIEYLFFAAARVGGIHANNTYPAEFIYENLMIQTNVINEAFKAGIKNLLFLGSSCIYPRESPQPLKEEYLLTAPLEPTNEPYAVAKIAGIKLCESYNRQYGTRYISVMPTNLYGPGDNYDLQMSHVLPALIRKFHLAKLASEGDWEGILIDEQKYGPIPEDVKASLGFDPNDTAVKPQITLWGTGQPYREFMHVDDAAVAMIYIMNLLHKDLNASYKDNGADKQNGVRTLRPQTYLFNIGTGSDISIRELAEKIAVEIGYAGPVIWDSSKPDGIPRKLLDVSRMKELGWRFNIPLSKGIEKTYKSYL